MDHVQQLTQYFLEYEAAVQELQSNRRMFDGIMGMGTHPGNAACHELLDKQVAELCKCASEDDTTPSELAEMVRMIFLSEQQWKGPEYARLMLVAIQRHTLQLIPMLSQNDRSKLSEWYQNVYPRRKRVPVQDQVLKALQNNCK